MKYQGHLYLDEAVVEPCCEWRVPFSGWCFLRVAEGHGYWLGGPEVKEVGAGQVLICFPMSKGLLRASRLGEVRLNYFRFCPELLAGLLTLTERQSLDSLADRAEGLVQVCPADDPAALVYGELGERVGSVNGWLSRCQMLEIAARLLTRELESVSLRAVSVLSAGKRVRVLTDRLTEAEMLNYSSADLARRCGCSIRHFGRLFQSCFGVSFRAKQAELRLAKARQMLVETNLRVRDVAWASGYRHMGLFNASFKRQFGMTPTDCGKGPQSGSRRKRA